MHFSTLTWVTLSVVASQVAAGAAHAARHERISQLFKRQTVNCNAQCAVFEAAQQQTCKTDACLCTPAIASGAVSCIQCTLTDNPSADLISQMNSLVTAWGVHCPTVPLPFPTAGGSTSAPPKTSTVVVSSKPAVTSSTHVIASSSVSTSTKSSTTTIPSTTTKASSTVPVTTITSTPTPLATTPLGGTTIAPAATQALAPPAAPAASASGSTDVTSQTNTLPGGALSLNAGLSQVLFAAALSFAALVL